MSLAQWQAAKQKQFTRAIATILAIAFLLPSISWAFESPASEARVQEVKVNGPEGKALANEYAIPAAMGKVVEAHRAASGMLFVLIQDLHCHVEVQQHIRGMLNKLVAAHPDIRLLAVEGGSGIIPNTELAILPDSPEKRAVANYFLQAGKLGGADLMVICDHPELEMYGAENSDMYNRSLVLVQKFITEENRGLMLEFLDQIAFLQERIYNPELLAFEHQRKYYQKVDADIEQYRKQLMQNARKKQITEYPESLQAKARQNNLDYQDRVQQLDYLEAKLKQQLILTENEKQLDAYQQFGEIAERIMNISASRTDLQTFQAMKNTYHLKAMTAELKKHLGDLFTHSDAEVSALEQALVKSLEFYQLAEERDTALYVNTLQRLQSRKESKVILITGGFHSQAIAEQIKAQGHSYIVIQPAMSKLDVANNYFDLLRYPEQPTEFERLLASVPAGFIALAVPKFQVLPAFRQQFIKAVGFLKQTAKRMQDTQLMRLPNMVVERVRGNIQVRSTDQNAQVDIRTNRADMQILTGQAANQATRSTNAMRSTTVQIMALGLLSGAIMAITILAMLGVGIAITPIAAVGAVIMLLLGTWWLANNDVTTLGRQLVNRRNVLVGSTLLGAVTLPFLLGLVGSDVVAFFTVGGLTSAWSPIRGILNTIHGLFSELLHTITVHTKDPAQAGVILANVSAFASVMPILGITAVPTGMAAAELVKKKSTPALHGSSFTKLSILDSIPVEEAADQRTNGVYYKNDEPRMQNAMISNEAIVRALKMLRDNGFGHFEDELSVDITKADILVLKNYLYCEPLPISVHMSLSIGDKSRLRTRVLIKDGVYKYEDGKSVAGTPAEYPHALLNNMNPYVLWVTHEHEIDKMLALTGKTNAPQYRQLLEYAKKVWEGPTKQNKVPNDIETAKQFLEEIFLHETNHTKLLVIPSAVQDTLPNEIKSQLQKITTDKYMKIMQKNPALLSSVEHIKNVYKALDDAKLFLRYYMETLWQIYPYQFTPADSKTGALSAGDQYIQVTKNILAVENLDQVFAQAQEWIDALPEERRKAFQDKFGKDSLEKLTVQCFNTHLTLETLCDRFSLLLKQNSLKIDIYNKTLKAVKSHLTVDIDSMLELEADRRVDNKAWRTSSDLKAISAEALNQLESELVAAEGQGVYIRSFKDVPIQPEEYELFIPLLNLQKHYENEKTNEQFDAFHIRNSSFFRATFDRLTATGAAGGVAQTIAATIDPLGSGMEAIAKGVNEAWNQPVVLETAIDMAAKSNQVPMAAVAVEPAVVSEAEIISEVPAFAFNFDSDMGTQSTELEVLSEVSAATQKVMAGGVSEVKVATDKTETAAVTTETKENTASVVLAAAIAEISMPAFNFEDTLFEESVNLASSGFKGVGEVATEGLGAVRHQSAIKLDQNFADGIKPATPLRDTNPNLPVYTPLSGVIPEGFAGATGKATNPQLTGLWVNPEVSPNAIPRSKNSLAGQPGSTGSPVGYMSMITKGSDLTKSVQSKMLGDLRSGYLIGNAMDLFKALPGNETITYGLDSPALADRLSGVLQEMKATAEGALVAARIRVEVFLPDASSGERMTPANWQAKNGIAVLSESMSPTRTNKVVVSKNGTLAMELPVMAVPRSAVTDQSLKTLLAESNAAMLKTIHNQGDLSNYYLVSADTMKQVQAGLLDGLITWQSAYQEMRALGLQSAMLNAIQAAAQPALQAGDQRVVFDFNYAGYQALEQAYASRGTASVLTFGLSEFLASDQLSYNPNAIFLHGVFAGKSVDAGLVDQAVQSDAMQSRFGVRLKNPLNWLKDLKQFLKGRSERASAAMTEDKAMELAEELMTFDNFTRVIKEDSLAKAMVRIHGLAYEDAASLFTPYYYNSTFRFGRKNVPMPKVGAWKPLIEKTRFTEFKAVKRIYASLLLGLAAGILILDTLVQVIRTRDSNGKRLNVVAILRHPGFLQALKIIFKLVINQGRPFLDLSPVVQQQIKDLQNLTTDEKNKIETEVEVFEQQALPTALNYSPLRYSLRQFIQFNKLLKHHAVAQYFIRHAGLETRQNNQVKYNLVPLYSELFALLSENNAMQDVMWYYAPDVVSRRNFEQAQGLHPLLKENLLRSAEEARVRLSQLRVELNLLKAAPGADQQRILTVNTLIKNMIFSIALQTTLDRMGRVSSPHTIRLLLRIIVRELGRTDIAKPEEYQAGILKVLSMMEPFHQIPVQIRTASGQIIQTSIPQNLHSTALRDQLLNFLEVFDTEGQPLRPIRKTLQTAATSA